MTLFIQLFYLLAAEYTDIIQFLMQAKMHRTAAQIPFSIQYILISMNTNCNEAIENFRHRNI